MRNRIELVLGIGLSLFLINYFTTQSDTLYICSIPVMVYGAMRMYQRHFRPHYNPTESIFPDDEADDLDDDLYSSAEEAVRDEGKASTSFLQRKLKVGYSRAARLIDLLEENKVIGPADGTRPREVIKQKE